MVHAARAHLESLLQARKLDVTLTTSAPWADRGWDLAPTGVEAIDAPLGGGLRRGHLSEIVGPPSSGRTLVVAGLLAAAAGRGEAVALIDTCDRFDPITADAGGLDLASLLWVRDRGDAPRALKAMNLVLQAGGFGVVAFDLADVPPRDLRQFPATTWMRLARAIEGSQTVAVLVGAERIARSPGGVTVALETARGTEGSLGSWTGTSDRARLLRALDVRPRVVRAR